MSADVMGMVSGSAPYGATVIPTDSITTSRMEQDTAATSGRNATDAKDNSRPATSPTSTGMVARTYR